ncbi:MAG: L-glutamate gamma-semialdehyde dehydrogenase [Deltaproteobacteria bacterium]|nr:L-glutamate gamma-semialdehyde dehydrogenase [Deltaproteobacteria bacterium]
MLNATPAIEAPRNEDTLHYGPGSPERRRISATLSELRGKEIEIPLIIGGREVRTGRTAACSVPHDHRHRLAVCHLAGPKETAMAAEAAREAAVDWAGMAWADRLAIFQKAADLIAGPHRMRINAATMLGQGKNVYQAEIDAACESADFLRFYCWNASRLFGLQPFSSAGVWNQMEYRPLEGFVFAISPFNFTALGVNLAGSPALLGNTVIWKPASSAVYSAYHLMRIFHEAGLPEGVINFLPGPGSQMGPVLLKHPELAGVHFTGSTAVFREIWKTVGANIDHYRSYPRLVGETGGKDFVFAHPSADARALAVALVRGAFEYQGQKCSAASRAYIPKSIWKSLKESLLEMIGGLRVGPPEDAANFVNAVIDKTAFDKIVSYIEFARKSPDAEIAAGGVYDDRVGYFIHPTVIVAKKPDFKTMVEEIFGPVLTLFVYDDDRYEETLRLCDRTSPYSLTGSIFARERQAIVAAKRILVNAAGNLYINDKPTGAMIGQQPFGGSRASGTNDKAGTLLNLMRWVSPRTIKETFVPATDYRYPFMESE